MVIEMFLEKAHSSVFSLVLFLPVQAPFGFSS